MPQIKYRIQELALILHIYSFDESDFQLQSLRGSLPDQKKVFGSTRPFPGELKKNIRLKSRIPHARSLHIAQREKIGVG
jgi:hypothetical protein